MATQRQRNLANTLKAQRRKVILKQKRREARYRLKTQKQRWNTPVKGINEMGSDELKREQELSAKLAEHFSVRKSG